MEQQHRPTVDQLREVTQPASVRGRRNAEHWTADLYLRRFSPYLTRELLRTSISANGVTWLMIAAGASAAFALLIPGWFGAVLAVALTQLQMLLDCCDGEIARWRRTFGPTGIFLDKLGHYTAETLIPVALGVRAAGGPSQAADQPGWVLLGTMLALVICLNKAVNDMVRAARAAAEAPPLVDDDTASAPRGAGLRTVRSFVRFIPFHRLYHSVELSILALIAAALDFLLGDLQATRWLVVLLVPAAVLSYFGHIVAVLASSRLRVQ